MFEKIYYNETNLDDEGNFTVDITNDDTVNKKKFLAGEEYLVSVVLIKAVRSNDLTKYSNFDKIKMLSEKINDSKKNLKRFAWFNHTVSSDGKPKVLWEENLRLVNQPETKIYGYFNTKKMKKDQITFEDYEGLFLNNFFRKLTSKTFEHVGLVKDCNFFWVLNNGKFKQSSDWIHYFFNTLSFTTDKYLDILSV